MELKDLFKIIKKHKKEVLGWMLLGALLGLGIFYLPSKYISTGSFFIRRATDNNLGFFTYEGYYSQQTALSYTNTVVGLFESIDVQSRALSSLGITVDETTLRKHARNIKVKKGAPQLVTLTVKGNTEIESKLLWQALAEEVITINQQLNVNGDSKLTVSRISPLPVVKKDYKSLWINIPAGILLTTAAGLFIISLKEYEIYS